MPGLSRRPTYQERKRVRAQKLEEQYADFTVDDLPDSIGPFELDFIDEDGYTCAKLDETYCYEHPDGRRLEISKHERRAQYEVLTRTTEDGMCYSKDEELGRFGYLGRAVEAAQERFGGA